MNTRTGAGLFIELHWTPEDHRDFVIRAIEGEGILLVALQIYFFHTGMHIYISDSVGARC